MATEDEQMTIVTVFDLEEYNHVSERALFKQRPPIERLGHIHHWSMGVGDWNALGRPLSFQMTLSPIEP